MKSNTSETIYCKRFLSVLSEIDKMGITRLAQLQEYQHTELYTKLWLTASDFINNIALTSKTSNHGKAPGNYYKVNEIIEGGVAQLTDIQLECLSRVITKIDLILRQPCEARKPYCIKIVNNVVNTFCRELQGLQEIHLVSFQQPVKGTHDTDEDAPTYEAFIADPYTPETALVLSEHIHEGQQALLHDIRLLSADSSRVLAHLSAQLHIAPRFIADFLLDKGIEATFTELLQKTAETYKIDLTSLSELINTQNLKKDPFKISTKDPVIIADKISHLRDYAKTLLKK